MIIGAAISVDVEHILYLVQRVGEVAYRDNIVAVTGGNGRGARHRPDEEFISIGIGARIVGDIRVEIVSAIDCEQVLSATEHDIQILYRVIENNAAHIQTEDLRGRQSTGTRIGSVRRI